jgi:phosphate transport system permease protein
LFNIIARLVAKLLDSYFKGSTKTKKRKDVKSAA